MPIRDTPLDEITAEHIKSLIDNDEREDRFIDYKQELYPFDTKGNLELAWDVSAFANALGGDLILGISETKENGACTGKPDAIVGLNPLNTDLITRKYSDVLSSRVQPRIPGVEMREVTGHPNGPLFIIRVPMSYQMPHIVRDNDSFRCYIRQGAAKGSPLDAFQLRQAFLMSSALPERIRAFRDGRISRIEAGVCLAPVTSNSKLIIHAFSVPGFDGTSPLRLNPQRLNEMKCPRVVSTFFEKKVQGSRFNLDGYLISEQEYYPPYGSPPKPSAYVQLYRHGIIEAVASLDNTDDHKDLLPLGFGFFTAEYVKYVLQYLKDDGFRLPAYVMISLTMVNGRRLFWPQGNSQSWPPGNNHPFDRATLLLPDVLIEDLDVDSRHMLQPALDALWQAGGWSHYFEPNYDPPYNRKS